MSKLQLNVKELQQTDVDLVSMVKRGANRIPFRFTKEDNEMGIDLHSISRKLFRKAETGPSVVAVMVAKSADLEAVTKALTDAGLDVATLVKSEDDTVVTLAKADADKVAESETFVLKFSDDVALLIQGDVEVVKTLSTYDWESTSFSEVMTKGAFVPSLGMAQEMLSRTFYNIIEAADSPANLAKMIGSATDEFKGYVASLAKGLPSSVFKAEAVLAKGKKIPADQSGTGTDAEDIADGGSDEGVEAKGKNTKKAEETVTEETKVEKTEETVEAKKEEAKTDAAPDLAAQLTKALADGLAAVTAQVEGAVKAMKADVAKVSERVEAVATIAKKADEAVSGTVLGDAAGEKTKRTVKSDEAKVPALLDTAFMKRDARGNPVH